MKRIEELTTPARERSLTSLWLEGYAREQPSPTLPAAPHSSVSPLVLPSPFTAPHALTRKQESIGLNSAPGDFLAAQALGGYGPHRGAKHRQGQGLPGCCCTLRKTSGHGHRPHRAGDVYRGRQLLARTRPMLARAAEAKLDGSEGPSMIP